MNTALFTRIRISVAGISLLSTLTSCSAYQITRGTHPSSTPTVEEGVSGVPFYILRGGCRHQTIYQENLFRLRLVVIESEHDELVPSKVLSRTQANALERVVRPSVLTDSALKLLRTAAEDRSNKDGVLNAFRSDIFKAYNAEEDWKTATTVLVSNTNTAFRYVDYSTPYYFNAERAIVGSTTATAELNGEGLLSKASTTVEDNTLSTILELMPIRDVLTHVFTPGSTSESNRPPRFEYQITLESVPILHTLTEEIAPATGPCPSGLAAIPVNRANSVSYSRVSPSSAQGDKPPASNAITVTGQLTLPPAKQ